MKLTEKKTSFTSHYVSINSINSVDEMQLAVNLHPTMYLLIPRTSVAKEEVFTFTSHYVSINSMYSGFRRRVCY